LLALFAVLACGPSSPEREENYLIRLGELKVTRLEFLQAFELVKTAHPGSLDVDSPALQQACRQLLDEMTLDLILRQYALERGISVSQAELEAAVAEVKADYPPGVFEQTLVESAIPIETWKRRLRSRRLMDKLVESELQPDITITAEDLTAYYQRHYSRKAAAADSEQKFERLKETLVADLRRAKLEDAIDIWIDGLRSKYPVELNASQWALIVEPDPKAVPSAEDTAEPGK
jgi:FKBP-type peptidyl-prolyl cis-trans isomerase (trigger factor)